VRKKRTRDFDQIFASLVRCNHFACSPLKFGNEWKRGRVSLSFFLTLSLSLSAFNYYKPPVFDIVKANLSSLCFLSLTRGRKAETISRFCFNYETKTGVKECLLVNIVLLRRTSCSATNCTSWIVKECMM
jgi:hypothetical protein